MGVELATRWENLSSVSGSAEGSNWTERNAMPDTWT